MPPNGWATAAELIGFLLAAYGLIRQSFADLAENRPFGEGRFGEGTFGGVPSSFATAIIAIGLMLRLLPPDRKLTATDRKRNAVLAICGILIGVLALAFEVWLSLPCASQ